MVLYPHTSYFPTLSRNTLWEEVPFIIMVSHCGKLISSLFSERNADCYPSPMQPVQAHIAIFSCLKTLMPVHGLLDRGTRGSATIFRHIYSMVKGLVLPADVLGSISWPGSLPWELPYRHWEEVLHLAWDLLSMEPPVQTLPSELLRIHRVACEVILQLKGEH